jgi:hypothetical protein
VHLIQALVDIEETRLAASDVQGSHYDQALVTMRIIVLCGRKERNISHLKGSQGMQARTTRSSSLSRSSQEDQKQD